MKPKEDLTEIDVHADEPLASSVDIDRIKDDVRATLTTVGWTQPASLTVVITNDATIRRLHRDYLGIDAPTDVLAFSQTEGTPMPASQAAPPYLGDVIVSYERAVAQAAEYDEPVEQELCRLVIHGTLHLLGYDDHRETDRKDMWEIQERILNRK